jgi:hypothetical protein
MQKARAELHEFFRDRPAEVEQELACLGPDGAELDRDGDGFGCLDCNDADPAIRPGAAETCDSVDTDCDRRADNAPACACGQQTIGAASFALCDVPMAYADAAAFCATRGESLAWIDDEAQTRAIHAAAHAIRGDKWYLGLDDRAVEGRFRWLAGDREPAYARWEPGEPDNAGCNQDCVVLDDDDDAEWTDTHCREVHPFVCRKL